MKLSPLAPGAFHAAEELLSGMQRQGWTPRQSAEAFIAALFLMNHANGVSDENAMRMFAETYAAFLRARPILPTITVQS